MKNCIKKIILTSSAILLIGTTGAYATDIEKEVVGIEKSQLFEKWQQLDETEKQNTIPPSYYNIPIKDSVKRSLYNNLLKSSNTVLEEKYDLRENIENIFVKNQRKVGACWAFSFTSTLETTLAHKYNKTGIEYSPMHMDYMSAKMFNRTIGSGGTKNMALSYLTGGFGPVFENEFPFENVYDEINNDESQYYLADLDSVELNQTIKSRVTDATFFASIYKTYSDDKITYTDATTNKKEYSDEEVEVMRQLVKKQIKEEGAVSAIFYSDMGITSDDTYISIGNYYNPTTNAYYCNINNIQANHAVTIVGWDDTFKKENFSSSHMPLNDGAYIVLNSWGEEFGDNGYFYVSYDDVCIEREITGINSLKEYDDTNFENIYQYDELGTNYGIRLRDSNSNFLTSVEVANVFERKDTSKKEYLTEVGLNLMSTEGVEVYINSEDDNLDNATTLIATSTGANALESGYHSLKLAAPVELTGEKFVVKVKYINSEIPIVPLEMNYYDNGVTNEEGIYDKATSNVGESYIFAGGTRWLDISEMTMGGKPIKNTNVCIKAFSTTQENSIINVEKVELDKENAKIQIGETVELTATITPLDATNKNIEWTSSNINVAIVENGAVTGLSEGTTTITVTTEDGKLTDACTITVEKKEEEPEVISVTSVTLDKELAKIKIGETVALTATVEPLGATNKNIEWTSSDENVATVSNGIVTGLSEGTTTITVTTEDGNLTDTCEITVEKKEEEKPTIINVTGVMLNKKQISMQVEDETNLTVTITPTNATNKNVTWKSSNEDIVTISNEGIITAKTKGTAEITVKTEDGGYTATCIVTVTEKTNSDDDIYKEENESNINNNKDDSTVADKEFPFAGSKFVILLSILAGIVFVIVVLSKYKKLDDIK